MSYPISLTEFRAPAHGAINAADRVCLTTIGFTGERGALAPPLAALTLVAASAHGDPASRIAFTDAILRSGGK